jgi:hypothetical protein
MIACDLGGSTAQDATGDDVHARDVGHALERQRAQRLEPRTSGGSAAAANDIVTMVPGPLGSTSSVCASAPTTARP